MARTGALRTPIRALFSDTRVRWTDAARSLPLTATMARVYGYAALVTLAAVLVTALYAHNMPAPFQPYHDSYEYVFNARRILAGGPWMDADRMPGYPLLLAIVFAVRGVDLRAAEIAQYALFVLTALEVYIICYRIWRRPALAALAGVLFGTNLYFLEYVKPILSDALAMWLCVSLCLSVVLFLERPRPLRLWCMTLLLLALIMTRAEWYLAPLVLFPFLFFVVLRRGMARRLTLHLLLALVCLFGVVILYARVNGAVNGYTGLSEAENINLYGKVVQYRMVDLAPPRYDDVVSITREGVAAHGDDVWGMYWSNPLLGADHFARVGAYAKAVILGHPLLFLRRSVPLGFESLSQYQQWPGITPERRTTWLLGQLLTFSELPFALFMLFPFVAAGWFGVWLWRWRRGPSLRVEMAAAVALLAFYDLALTTLGSFDEYVRLHLAFDPLMLLLLVGTLGTLAATMIRVPRSGAGTPSHAPPVPDERERDTSPEVGERVGV